MVPDLARREEKMTDAKVVAGAALLILLVAAPVQAFNGDPGNGKKLFMARGARQKACMTCHPAGKTTGESFRGDDIPDLTRKHSSERKIRRMTLKFLKHMELTLTDAEVDDLLTFVQQLPDRDFGPVPPEWQAHVKKYVR
jgi:mono/diheme cytochrome c family protein